MAAFLASSCHLDPEAVKKSWHDSFIKSCVGGDSAKQAMCTCMADKAVAELTSDQLLDISGSIKYIKETAAPACAEESREESQ